MNKVEIQFRLQMVSAKLQTSAPLIEGTDEGRALAKKAVIDASAELGEIASIIAGLME